MIFVGWPKDQKKSSFRFMMFHENYITLFNPIDKKNIPFYIPNLIAYNLQFPFYSVFDHVFHQSPTISAWSKSEPPSCAPLVARILGVTRIKQTMQSHQNLPTSLKIVSTRNSMGEKTEFRVHTRSCRHSVNLANVSVCFSSRVSQKYHLQSQARTRRLYQHQCPWQVQQTSLTTGPSNSSVLVFGLLCRTKLLNQISTSGNYISYYI